MEANTVWICEEIERRWHCLLSRSDLLGDDDHIVRLGLRTQWDAGRAGDSWILPVEERKEKYLNDCQGDIFEWLWGRGGRMKCLNWIQVCANQCSLSSICGAFYVEGGYIVPSPHIISSLITCIPSSLRCICSILIEEHLPYLNIEVPSATRCQWLTSQTPRPTQPGPFRSLFVIAFFGYVWVS